MRTWLPALAAFAASLYPLTAFWLAAPDHPRPVLAALLAGAAAVWVLCAVVDGWLDVSQWLRRIFAAGVLLWLAYALVMAEPSATLAFLLSGGAAMALGARLLSGLRGLTAIEHAVMAYLTGLAVLVAALSLLLGLPVHYPWAYAIACLQLLAWQRRALLELLSQVRAQWQATRHDGMGGAPLLALVALGLWVWGALGTLTPVAAYDDLAYHLRLPYELLHRHRYSFDVVSQVWAVAPWASDLAFALPFVISGGDEGVKVWVAGSYHFATAVLLLGLLARRLPLRAALWFLLAYLAIPLVMALHHTLHTEALSAALVLALFSLWAGQRHAPSTGLLVGVALLAGLLGTAKASNLVACGLLGLLWLPALWQHVKTQHRTAALLMLAFATVLTPYVTAWLRTGNPLLPLFNAYFQSPYFGSVNVANEAVIGLFDWQLFERLFLNGRRVLEPGLETAGGLVLFMLLPPALLLLAWQGDVERRAALAIALAYSLVLLSAQQYLRYLFPVMGLALFAVSRVWDEPDGVARPIGAAWRGWWAVLLALSVGVGAYSMPNAFWQTKLEYLGAGLIPGDRSEYLRQVAPERALNQLANAHMGANARVLYLGNAVGADLQGTPVYANWYNPRALAAALEVRDEATAAEFYRAMRITHVMPRRPVVPTLPGQQLAQLALEAYARAHGTVIATSGDLVLIALHDNLVWRHVAWELPAEHREARLRADEPGVGGFGAVGAGSQVLIEVEGRCESLRAIPWVDLQWRRQGVPLSSVNKFEPCLPTTDLDRQGIFRIRARLQAPPTADSVRIQLGAMTASGARVTAARVRALAAP